MGRMMGSHHPIFYRLVIYSTQSKKHKKHSTNTSKSTKNRTKKNDFLSGKLHDEIGPMGYTVKVL